MIQARKGAKAVRRSIATLEPAPMRRAVRQLVDGTEKLVGVDLEAAGDRCTQSE